MIRSLLILLALASTAAASFTPVGHTPYDSQMQHVRSVVRQPAADTAVPLSVQQVDFMMVQLNGLSYRYRPEWLLPEELEQVGSGDCKAKAVALMAEMKRHGGHNITLVIGKRGHFSSQSHTWLLWETPYGSYLLDPTFFACAWPASTVHYIPMFAYRDTQEFVWR